MERVLDTTARQGPYAELRTAPEEPACASDFAGAFLPFNA